ncbi:MAG: hypothetical protein L0271_09245 [Gemmatimonadetes bacterium]|nr:hypothetical protein [Gemmatimonadota bacterium]
MFRRAVPVVLAAILAPPAQAAAQRPGLHAFRDSLATITDVAALRRAQAALPMPGTARDPESLIRRGLIGLRVYELTQDPADSERVREVFERGAERFAGEAWLHYGLGLALARAPEVRIGSPGGVLHGVTLGQSLAEILGRDPRARARNSFLRSLELDPGFGAAAVELADLAVADGRSRDDLLEARAALTTAVERGASDDAVRRALSDVESALGDPVAAEAAVSDASGADALLARAVSLLLQPGRADEGAAAYTEGVDQLTERAAARYYRDLEPIVLPAEEAEWRVADLTGRQLWLRRFWSRRAAESGVTEAERLAEHYARFAFARRHYLRNSQRGVDGGGVLLAEAAPQGSPFDDRGVVLIRRGLPVRVVTTTQRGLFPNESWVYIEPGAADNVLFHFVALRGARDFTLVSDLFQALDNPVVQQGDDRLRAVLTLVEDRAAFEPQYQAAAVKLRAAMQRGASLDGTEIRSIVERAEADYRREARLALQSDVHHPRFDRPVPFHFDLFSFRTPFGRTDLTAAFAIPAETVAAMESADGYVYPLELSVILLDTLQGTVTRRDTTRAITTTRLLASGEFLRPHIIVPVVPSEHTVFRVVVRSPIVGGGSVYAGATLIRELGGPGLLVSDLVLAEPDTAGDWVRGDQRLALTLPRRFRPGRPFRLFYEVYNLVPESQYRTRVEVGPAQGRGFFGAVKSLFGFGPPTIDLSFDDRAAPGADGVVQELRDLGTDLPPGTWRMRVTVTDVASGATAVAETIFEVIR